MECHSGEISYRHKFAIAPGTAIVQKRNGGDSITIVVGGDAGTAEGDFASCLVWSTRPRQSAARPDRRHEQRLGHLHGGWPAAR